MMEKFDVIIPVAGKDVQFVHRVTKYVRRYLLEADIIYIMTNAKNFARISKNIKGQDQVVILDEDKIIAGLTYNTVKSFAQAHTMCTSFGWYYQQFLKLGFAKSKYAHEYYMAWDADTIPVSEIRFFCDGKPTMAAKNEYNENYFVTLEKILGLQKSVPFSYIAEHMLFKTSIVKDMLTDIESRGDFGNNWFETILVNCNFNTSQPAFSEFETYGTYVHTYYPDLYTTRCLRTFRRGGWIRGRYISDKMLDALSLDLETISFELRDQPPFPYNIPNKWWRFKDLLFKLTHNKISAVTPKVLRYVGIKK